jgi:opacity protein-like surface antigen
MRSLLLSGLLCAAVTATPCWAQSYRYQDTAGIHWHLEGGYAPTVGRTSDYLNGGGTVGGGFTFTPSATSPLSLRADVSYSQFDATRHLIYLGEQQSQTHIDDGTGRIVNFDLDGVFNIPLTPRVSGYLFAGVGGAYRRIDLTQTVGFGGYYCDYWYGYCGIGVFPGDVLIQRDETTRFAWNAGLGLEFPLYSGPTFFVEARYNRIETREPTEFIPIRVGLRF